MAWVEREFCVASHRHRPFRDDRPIDDWAPGIREVPVHDEGAIDLHVALHVETAVADDGSLPFTGLITATSS